MEKREASRTTGRKETDNNLYGEQCGKCSKNQE